MSKYLKFDGRKPRFAGAVDRALWHKATEIKAVQSGEKIVATLTPELRKLYSELEWWRFAEMRGQKEVTFAYKAFVAEEEMLSMARQLLRTREVLSMTEQIFWVKLQDRFSLWGGGNMAIRKGGKVVMRKAK